MKGLHPLDRKLFEIKQICNVLETLVEGKNMDLELTFGELDEENDEQETWEEFLTHLSNSINEVNRLQYFNSINLSNDVKRIDVETSKTTIKFFALKYRIIKNLLNELIVICDLYSSDTGVVEWKESVSEVMDSLEYYDDYMEAHL